MDGAPQRGKCGQIRVRSRESVTNASQPMECGIVAGTGHGGSTTTAIVCELTDG